MVSIERFQLVQRRDHDLANIAGKDLHRTHRGNPGSLLHSSSWAWLIAFLSQASKQRRWKYTAIAEVPP